MQAASDSAVPAPNRPAARRAAVQRVRPSEPAWGEFVRTYACQGRAISVGTWGTGLRLIDGGMVYDLSPVGGVPGQVFAGAGAVGHARVTLAGQDVAVQVNGVALRACTLTRQWPMPWFRATGHEPSWLFKGELELAHWTVGDKLFSVAVRDDQPLALGQPYRMADDPDAPVVMVSQQVCRDGLSGMPHPYTVGVTFEGRTLSGCGGDPHTLLTGRQWVVKQVAAGAGQSGRGEGVLSPLGHDVTIQFDGKGRVSGVGPCNRFSAIYALTAERLSIGSVTSTRRACLGGAMQQEHALFGALESVVAFVVSPAGEMTLVTREAAERGEAAGIVAH